VSGAALAGLGWKLAADVIGQVFGTLFSQYRPSTAGTLALLPLQSGNLLTSALPDCGCRRSGTGLAGGC
jgi:hypothetical protein